jgi:hypothetical protein
MSILYSPKKLLLTWAVFLLGVFSFIVVWDFLSGPGEKWIHSASFEEPKILGEYSSFDECWQHMNSQKGPNECRRVDGPHRILNWLEDIAL